MQQLLCALLTAYLLVFFARAILSWLPPSGGAMASVNRVLADLTEPLAAPARRLIPPAGPFDLSFIVIVIVLGIVRNAVCR